MQVYYSTDNLPELKNAVLTVGTFDGVHIGHRQIIKQLKEEAADINGETVIITFHPHPRTVVAGKKTIELLNSLNEKIYLLGKLSIDHLVIIPFDEVFSNQSPEAYIKQFLYDKFHPHTVIIGYDHKFGKNRAGDYHLLENYGKQLGFSVKEIPEKIINESIVSSTIIRKALLQHDIENANKYLGYPYFFEGIVVDGNKLGRTLGYPTANIIIRDEMKLVPANGIYIAEAEIVDRTPLNKKHELFPVETITSPSEDTQLFKGMMSIGVRPTIDGKNRTIEINIFDFEEDIYGKTLKVFIHKYLRDEVKFNSLDDLKAQMLKDKSDSLNYFAALRK
jgi:riboflavin kinase/FMN adenylyltransferase